MRTGRAIGPLRRLTFPGWARRENPIVQREMGLLSDYDTIPVWSLRRLFLIQTALILGSLLLNLPADVGAANEQFTAVLLILLIVPVAYGIAAALILPVGLFIYARLLDRIIQTTTAAILRERRDDNLTILRTIPPSLREIFLSSIAGAIWPETPDLNTVLGIITWLSLPPIIVLHTGYWPTESEPLLVRLGFILGLGASMLRPLLEVVMVGALGMFCGAFTRIRLVASTIALLLTAAYFVLINLPRGLILPMGWRLLIESVLPLLLPVVITWGAVSAAAYLLTRD
jgi:hypothetical protein